MCFLNNELSDKHIQYLSLSDNHIVSYRLLRYLRFFILGYGEKAGSCRQEKQGDRLCPEGWESDDYNTYDWLRSGLVKGISRKELSRNFYLRKNLVEKTVMDISSTSYAVTPITVLLNIPFSLITKLQYYAVFPYRLSSNSHHQSTG
jgi:hypothetical protein